MIVVGIYIYDSEGIARRIELFSDEKISVTSSVQDIADISKTFTDFSQSFTVPATPHNNAIFKHWYDNDVDDGFDARTRKDGFIELDTIPFRIGKIQLEKAQFKNGELDNYQITFFGSVVSLKDKFNSLNLKDLDFSSLDFNYTGGNIKDRVEGLVDSDVKFPLISSKNVWQWDTGGAEEKDWDISKSATPIYHTDLFPAVRLSAIFDAIASKIGVTFNENVVDSFLDDPKFTRAFLWFKNNNSISETFAPKKINFNSVTATAGFSSSFDVGNDELNFVQPSFPYYVAASNLRITFSDPGVGEEATNFRVFIYKDGVKISEQSYVTQTTEMFIPLPLNGTAKYTFNINSDASVTYTSSYYLRVNPFTGFSLPFFQLTATQSTAQTSSASINLPFFAPELTLEEFFSGVLKTFNLTCYSEDGQNFIIEQLENWYLKGDVIDLTKYTTTESIDISKTQIYKSIKFKFEESKNVLATEYLSRSSTPYGDLLYSMEVDGTDYSVELPFETFLMQKFTGTNLQVGTSVDFNLSPIIPGPVLLYDYGTLRSQDFYFNNGLSTSKVLTYNLFGQDTNIGGENYTLNFGIEQSTYTGRLETNSLFANYYEDYLSNIFSKKARLLKIKSILPIGALTSLRLNDRIIIRGKRYIIQSFTTDLTTGEVEFLLITDFREAVGVIPPTGDYSSLDYSQTDYNV
jgi:hypothetical protein